MSGDRRMSLNQDEQPANDPANMDPPINQVRYYIGKKQGGNFFLVIFKGYFKTLT